MEVGVEGDRYDDGRETWVSEEVEEVVVEGEEGV